MKLKRHRDDVRLLKDSWASHGGSPVFVDIAGRYQRLILMAEQQFKYLSEFNDPNLEDSLWPQEKQVLKDAKCSTK